MEKSLIHSLERPEKEIYIYGLCDPNTGELRYIGLSTVGFKRIASHYDDCKAKNKQGRLSKSKSWIKRLKENNQIFQPIYLEYFDNDGPNVDEAEIFWISYFRMIGSDLLNHDNGGRVNYLRFNSSENKQKQSIACKKTNGTPEKRDYFSKETKRQWQDPEIRQKRLSAMKNKPRTEEQKNNMRLGNIQRFELTDDLGNIYLSLHDAAKQLNVSAMTIHRALKNNIKIKGRTLQKTDRRV